MRLSSSVLIGRGYRLEPTERLIADLDRSGARLTFEAVRRGPTAAVFSRSQTFPEDESSGGVRGAIEQHGPGTNLGDRQHLVLDPGVVLEVFVHVVLALGRDDEEHILFVQWPTEHDYTQFYERVHELGVLVEQLLLAQALRPVPRPAVLLVD